MGVQIFGEILDMHVSTIWEAIMQDAYGGLRQQTIDSLVNLCKDNSIMTSLLVFPQHSSHYDYHGPIMELLDGWYEVTKWGFRGSQLRKSLSVHALVYV